MALLNFFEGLGTIARHQHGLRIKVIDEFWGTGILDVWKLWKPEIRGALRQHSATAFRNFEFLAEAVERRRDRQELKKRYVTGGIFRPRRQLRRDR